MLAYAYNSSSNRCSVLMAGRHWATLALASRPWRMDRALHGLHLADLGTCLALKQINGVVGVMPK